MNVTMIGAGKMGRGIGYRLMAGGHSVTLIATSTESAEKLAAELKGVAKKGAAVKVAALESASLDDVVILALWYPKNQEVVEQLGARLAGKTVVDIANPVNSTYDGLAVPANSSSPEELAKVAPAGTKFVKAFNTAFAGTLVAGDVAGQKLDIFIAGDDAGAKQAVAQLVSDGGMTPVDVGALQRARLLEGLGLLGITLQGPLHLNWASGWRLVH
jgi:8-hydroxy-5-deazaflavin:NADPH oxidoreductase